MTHTRHGLRFEFLLGSLLLGLGLFAMPAMVYLVGVSAFGPYGERADLGRFYGDFFGDLATGSVRAWLLLLGPLLMVSLLRLVLLRRPVPEPETEAASVPVTGSASGAGKAKPGATSHPAGASARHDTRRREPSVSLD